MFIQYLLILFGCLFGCLLVAELINLTFGKKINHLYSIQELFVKITLGSLLICALCAIYYTAFKSIFTLLLPLILYLFWLCRDLHFEVKPIGWMHILALIFSLLLLYVNFYLQYLPFEIIQEGSFNAEISDFHFTTSISHYLTYSGQENEFMALNVIDKDFHGVKPYHYWELWLTGFVSDLLGVKNFAVAYVVVFPFFYFLVFLGLVSVFEKLVSLNKLNIILLGFISLLLGGISTGLLSDLSFLANLDKLEAPILYNQRMSGYYIFLCLAVVLYSNRISKKLILVLIVFGFVQFTPVLSVLSAVSLSILYFQWRYKSFSREDLLISIAIVGASVVGFLIVGSVFGNSEITREGTSVTDLFSSMTGLFKDFSKLKTSVNVVVGSVIHVILLYLPMIIGLGIAASSSSAIRAKLMELRKHPLFLMFAIMIITGLVLSAVLFEITDSSQLFHNVVFSILNVISLLCVILLISYRRKLNKLVWIGGLIVLFIPTIVYGGRKLNSYVDQTPKTSKRYSVQYLEKIKEVVNKENLKIGASFRGSETYTTVFSAKVTIYTLGDYLSSMCNGCMTVSLTDLRIPLPENELDRWRFKNGYEIGSFYRYVAVQKANNEFVDETSSQLQFIRDKNLRYAIFSPGYEIPAEIQSLVSLEIIDELSKEKFVVFNLNE